MFWVVALLALASVCGEPLNHDDISKHPAECDHACTGGRCYFEDCDKPTCKGGLCHFVRCPT